MDSAVSGTSSTSVSVEAMKKAMDVQENQVTRILEGATQQSQNVQQQQPDTSQKTGMGKDIDLKA